MGLENTVLLHFCCVALFNWSCVDLSCVWSSVHYVPYVWGVVVSGGFQQCTVGVAVMFFQQFALL